jgi:SnoaL-like domain
MNDEMTARFLALEARVDELEDVNAIRRLHWAYGYYIDFNRADDVVQLFSDDGAVVFLSGEYRGHEGIRRLYGTWFKSLFLAPGEDGPANGFLLDHFQMQDIITIAPDRQTAKGRFRGLLFGGSHESRTYKPEGVPLQFYEAGLYENDYVREEGVWKIKRLDYMMQWQADYEAGWSRTTAHLQPAIGLYPDNPIGPDILLPANEVRQTWPNRQDVPMHYAHPRFGAVMASANPAVRPG